MELTPSGSDFEPARPPSKRHQPAAGAPSNRTRPPPCNASREGPRPMMMCDLLLVIDPKHPDRNSLAELAAALESMGAPLVDIDAARHVIEAVVPAAHLATLDHLG